MRQVNGVKIQTFYEKSEITVKYLRGGLIFGENRHIKVRDCKTDTGEEKNV